MLPFGQNKPLVGPRGIKTIDHNAGRVPCPKLVKITLTPLVFKQLLGRIPHHEAILAGSMEAGFGKAVLWFRGPGEAFSQSIFP